MELDQKECLTQVPLKVVAFEDCCLVVMLCQSKFPLHLRLHSSNVTALWRKSFHTGEKCEGYDGDCGLCLHQDQHECGMEAAAWSSLGDQGTLQPYFETCLPVFCSTGWHHDSPTCLCTPGLQVTHGIESCNLLAACLLLVGRICSCSPSWLRAGLGSP